MLKILPHSHSLSVSVSFFVRLSVCLLVVCAEHTKKHVDVLTLLHLHVLTLSREESQVLLVTHSCQYRFTKKIVNSAKQKSELGGKKNEELIERN
jgi:hypothetical protein